MIKLILVLILSLNLTHLFAQQLPGNAVNVAAAPPAQPAQPTGLTKVFADQSEAANKFVAKEIQKNKAKMLGKRRK